MRSRPSGTGRRSGYTRQADRGDLRPLSDATVRPRGKPPGAGRRAGRPRGPLQVTADVVILHAESLMLEIYTGRLRPGRLQRISEKTRSASATTSSENLRKHGQREAAVKRGGYAAIRRIPRPRRRRRSRPLTSYTCTRRTMTQVGRRTTPRSRRVAQTARRAERREGPSPDKRRGSQRADIHVHNTSKRRTPLGGTPH
jgi:hypothetical protein